MTDKTFHSLRYLLEARFGLLGLVFSVWLWQKTGLSWLWFAGAIGVCQLVIRDIRLERDKSKDDL